MNIKKSPSSSRLSRMKQVGHRRYDQFLQEIMEAVSRNASRDELLRMALNDLEQLSAFGAIAVLELESESSDAAPPYFVKGVDQRRIIAPRWAAFLEDSRKNPLADGVIVDVILSDLEVDLWHSNYFSREFNGLKGLFDVTESGWLAALRLPRANARQNHRGIFLWYDSSLETEPPSGAEQDWRFLTLFRSCYKLASFQTRKVAASIIESRKDLLRAIAPSLLAHEVYGRLEKMTASFETLLDATRVGDLQVIDSEVRETLIPYVRKIKEMSDSLMALTRRFSGCEMDPVAEINNARDVLTHQTGTTGGWVEEARGEIPKLVTDPSLFTQIMVNLIKNALESSEGKRGVHVSFDLRVNKEKSFLEVDVIDDGPGVSPSLEERLFEVGGTTKPSGHGLGLHISRMIAEHLGGSLVLNSPRNHTIFRLTLPLQPSNLDALEDELSTDESAHE